MQFALDNISNYNFFKFRKIKNNVVNPLDSFFYKISTSQKSQKKIFDQN